MKRISIPARKINDPFINEGMKQQFRAYGGIAGDNSVTQGRQVRQSVLSSLFDVQAKQE